MDVSLWKTCLSEINGESMTREIQEMRSDIGGKERARRRAMERERVKEREREGGMVTCFL